MTTQKTIKRQEAFFECSNEALHAISSLFDLVWPLDLGLWLLRKEVKKDLYDFPKASEEELAKKYAQEAKIHGINYRKDCLMTPWEQQQEEIAWLLLISVLSIYEGWMVNLHDKVFNTASTVNLQLPSFVLSEVQSLKNPSSNFMIKYFKAPYEVSRNQKIERDFAHVPDMLLCYRVFKEMRNCYIHNNRYCSEELEKAYQNYIATANASNLHVKELPKMNSQAKGNKIVLELRGVVSISGIIQNIILSVDTELLQSETAEKLFVSKFQTSKWNRFTAKSSSEYKQKMINSFLQEYGYKVPTSPVHFLNEFSEMILTASPAISK